MLLIGQTETTVIRSPASHCVKPCRKKERPIVVMRCQWCEREQSRHAGATRCLLMAETVEGRVVCSGPVEEVGG